jgi:erythromycin esterase-like protein
MVDMVLALQKFLRSERRSGALVLWAHNSHLGDARATEMHELGELNVGQLVRERFGPAATLVGFTSFDGTVTAATSWDGPAQCMQVRPALPQSYEALFHAVVADMPSHNALFDLTVTDDAVRALSAPRLERAIGVIYRPETERHSHYFASRLPAQFDFVAHLDHTRAVEPLERYGTWSPLELPETYPSTL